MARIAKFKLPDGRIAKYSVPDDFSPPNTSALVNAEPQTFAGKAANAVRSFEVGQNFLPISMKFDGAVPSIGLPFTSGSTGRLEDVGQNVNKAYESSVENIVQSPSEFPEARGVAMGAIEAGRSMLPVQGLAPSEMATGIGAEAALPIATIPLARRANLFRRSMGNKFVGTPIQSLKKSFRDGTDTLGEKFLNSDLPANREEAFAVSSNRVDSLERRIQAALDKAVASGKVEKPDVSGDEFEIMKAKLQEPTVLPSGNRVQRFVDAPAKELTPNASRSPYGYEDPEALNLTTKGRKFAKGESKGFLNPEDPNIESKQIEYLKKQREEDILKAREAFKKRISNPEYSKGLSKDFAIPREKISTAIKGVIDDAGKTGFEEEAVTALKGLKDDFEKAHPEFADVQYWNDVKRSIYKRIGDKGYLAKNATDKVSAMKGVASAIRSEIERVVPGIKALNQEQGKYLEFRNALGDTLASRSKNNVTGIIKSELQDEAMVRAARRKFAQKFPDTIGTSAATLPIVYGNDENLP